MSHRALSLPPLSKLSKLSTFSILGTLMLILAAPLTAAVEPDRKLPDYDMTGRQAGIDGLKPLRVEGIGLVIGLAGTGSDPPMNNYRKWLIEIMKKKGVEDPAKVLRSNDTSIVLLRAYIPGGARKGDPIDVEVFVPPGDDAMSIRGGFLLEAELKEHVIANGQHLKNKGTLQGDTWLKVDGPVLVATDHTAKGEDSATLKKGTILGRGRVVANRDFRLVLQDGKKSQERVKTIASVVNQRFHARYSATTGEKGIANPVDYQVVNLGIPREYENNVEQYLHVVRRIPMAQSTQTEYRERLLSLLEADLMRPSTTIEAALRLEGIGASAIPVLKEGLLSDHEIVRFCSAQSLAYLKDPSGYKILAELADKSNWYRGYALAALIAHDHPLARTHLTRLLDSQSSEARYGAFRAMWMLDDTDPSLAPRQLGPDQFSLHLIDSRSPAMTHISQSFRREIVLFNPRQQLLPPLTLRAGDYITVTASKGSNEVHLYSSRPGPKGTREQRRIAGLSLAEVITEAASLGATYPDIVDMLMQASEGHNLTGQLVVNALPRPPRLETLDALARDEGARQWQAVYGSTPNLFDTGVGLRPGKGAFASGTVESASADKEDSDLEEDLAAEESAAPSEKKRSVFNFFRRSAN